MKRELKILIVCQYYFPEPFLIHEIASELVKRGHTVTVLTGIPNYPEGIVPKEYQKGKRRKEIIDGVQVIRCNEIPRRGGILKLFLNYFSYMISAKKEIKKLNRVYDLVFCYQLSPITMLAPAIAYKKLYNTPLLAYCLDIWPESAKAHIPEKKVLSKIILEIIRAYSQKMYGQCDRIAVTSEPFMSYLHETLNIPCSKMTYIPQHADDRMLNMKLEKECNGMADFMFAGNLGKGQKLDTIIKAAAILKRKLFSNVVNDYELKDFCVHIVGDGSMKKELEHLAEELKVKDKVIFYGRKNRDEMNVYYKKADALIITLRGNNFVGNTMPGKLQTYMTTGKPILGAINGAAMQVIEQAQCGSCVPAEDVEGLSRIMQKYMECPGRYSECGRNAQRYFRKNFTLEVFMERLEREMLGIVKNEIK